VPQIDEYLAKLRGFGGKAHKVHETTTFLLVTLPNIHRLNFFFTDRLSNKPFLIWLLTTHRTLNM